MTSFPSKLRKYFVFVSVTFTVCCLFTVAALSVFVWAYRQRNQAWVQEAQIIEKYGLERILAAYPGWPREDVLDLLRNTWSIGQVYEPFTHFRETGHRSRFVNVHEAGFRLSKDQGPWPPSGENLNVFLFGGSTTFGYGLPDDETLASSLQTKLNSRGFVRPVRVYNFGRGFYYSSQELALFSKLIREGYIPHCAVFVDGLNEFAFSDRPKYSDLFEFYLKKRPSGLADTVYMLVNQTPLAQFVKSTGQVIGNRLESRFAGSKPDDSGSAQAKDARIQEVIASYLSNIRMIRGIAVSCQVQPLFVWQPVPTYRYNLKFHAFAEGIGEWNLLSGPGYEAMAKEISRRSPGDDFLWAADIQEGIEKPLYVDGIHYAPALIDGLAERISQKIQPASVSEAIS